VLFDKWLVISLPFGVNGCSCFPYFRVFILCFFVLVEWISILWVFYVYFFWACSAFLEYVLLVITGNVLMLCGFISRYWGIFLLAVDVSFICVVIYVFFV